MGGKSMHAAYSAASSVKREVTVCAVRPKYLLRDGARVLAQSTCRSEVMKAAARAPHGAELGVEGRDSAFVWNETLSAWVYTP